MTTKTLEAPAVPPKVAPGPDGCLILGNVRALQEDPIAFFLELARDYGDVARIRLGPEEALVVRHPDHVKHVLADRAATYKKPTRFVKALEPLLGNGLLLSEGDFWKRQRRIANPVFHRQRIAGFADTFVRTAAEAVDRWRNLHRDATFDVAAEMQRLTLSIVGRTLFSMELGGEADQVGPAVETASTYAYAQMNSLFITPSFLPTPGNLKFKAAVRALDEVVVEMVEKRRRGETAGNDLLQLMLDARDEESGEGMTDQQLRDELMTFYLAGHETTSNALSWALYLLGKSPTVERRLRAELEGVLGGRLPTLDDVKSLVYTTQVLDEAMRLYPPAWLIAREAAEDDEIAGYRVKAGTQVFFSAYVTHRDPRFFDNPEGFDPEHFAPEKAKARHLYAYYPFGAGQRKCIGAGFATLEMQLVLATVLQRCRLTLEPGFTAEMLPAVTLMPKHGVRVSARFV